MMNWALLVASILAIGPLAVQGQNLLMVIAGASPGNPRDVEYVNLNSDGTVPCQVKPPDYPRGVEGAVSTLLGGKPTVCSGGRRVEVIRECYRLDQNRWDIAYQLNNSRDYAAGVLLDEDNWWITGGYNPQDPDGTGNNFLKETEIVSLDGIKISPYLPVERERHAVLQLNNSAFLITGGRGATLDGSRTWIFNPNAAGDPYTEVNPSLVNRDGEYAGVITRIDGQKEVVVAGGNGQFSSEIYNPTMNSWRPGPSLPVALGGGASVQYDSTFLVIGGIDQSDQVLWDRIYRYVAQDSGADYFEELPARLLTPRRFHTAVLLPDDYVDCGN